MEILGVSPPSVAPILELIKDQLYCDPRVFLNSKHLQDTERHLWDSVCSGGKRLRPIMTLTVSEFLGRSANDPIVQVLASAVEKVHGASLAHDDVIDQANVRRGRPSLPARVGNGESVLLGDYMLAQVTHQIASLGSLWLVQELSGTIMSLVRGELIQRAVAQKLPCADEDIIEVCAGKTGALMGFSCHAPAILWDEDRASYWKEFGNAIGIAFQLADDLLDFQESTGKPQFQDAQSGSLNSVINLMVRNRGSLQEELSQWRLAACTSSIPWQASELAAAKDQIVSMKDKYLTMAADSLSFLKADQTFLGTVIAELRQVE